MTTTQAELRLVHREGLSIHHSSKDMLAELCNSSSILALVSSEHEQFCYKFEYVHQFLIMNLTCRLMKIDFLLQTSR